MAIELINKNNSILPHHNLDIIVSDTHCTPDVATKSFIKYITSDHKAKLAGILGMEVYTRAFDLKKKQDSIWLKHVSHHTVLF